MSAIPAIIIVADRGHLIAYRTTDTQSLEKIDTASFAEGNRKISEIVSDQAGSFATPGGHGSGSAESLHLVSELEVRSFRKVAAKIEEIFQREHPRWWGFAAPSEINGAIVDHIAEGCRERLSLNLKVDLLHSPPLDIYARFERAALAPPARVL